jgi:hypothetical protein
MIIHPIPQALFKTLVDAGVTWFELDFDRRLGTFEASVIGPDSRNRRASLIDAIESWAQVYEYDFDHDSESGDVISYDLLGMRTSHDAWYMTRKYEAAVMEPLLVKPDVKIEKCNNQQSTPKS